MNVCVGKSTNKKKVRSISPGTSVGNSVGSVGFSVGITPSASSQQPFYMLLPVAARGP